MAAIDPDSIGSGLGAVRRLARARLGALVAQEDAAPARQETHPLTVLALCDTVEELEQVEIRSDQLCVRLARYAERLRGSGLPVEARVGETLSALLAEVAQVRRPAASPTSRATTSAR